MRRFIACGLAAAGVLAGSVLAAEQRPIEPGDKIGVMTVVRGDAYDADLVMVEACPSIIAKYGTYHRACNVPKVPRIHIGESHPARTLKQLNIDWKRLSWKLWVDGRLVDLPSFGTSDSHHALYGKMTFFRRWRVILVDAPSGKHTVRYVLKDPSGTIDLTTALIVGK